MFLYELLYLKMVMTWKYGNVDDDDLRKSEKVFENEVVYVVFRFDVVRQLGP